MELYQNPDRPEHATNNAAFLRVVNEYPWMRIFKPSPVQAPWHVQAIVDEGETPITLNFWPHKLTFQREGFKSVQGLAALRGIIEGAYEDATEGSAFQTGAQFDLIERG